MKLASLSFIMVLLSANVASAEETLNISYFEHIPHQFKDPKTGKMRGATVRLFNMVAQKMGYKVNWISHPLPRVVNDLESGSVDGTSHIIKDPFFEKISYRATEGYYCKAQSVLVFGKDSPISSIESPALLKGLKIGFHDGTPASKFISDNKNLYTLKSFGGDQRIQQVLQMLIAGRLDAIHDLNAYTIPFEAKKMGVLEKIKVIKLPEEPGLVGPAFSKKSAKGKELAEKFSKAYKELGLTFADYDKWVEEEIAQP